MVGVPALARCTWGPSSRICCPMLFLSSHRMSNGVPSAATHRAIPPEVMRVITAARCAGPATRRAAASSRSSKGRTASPTTWVVSWPLPATTTTSPGRASADGGSDGLAPDRGSTTSSPGVATPASTSSMMAAGSSYRGLSEVTTATSAPRAATAPMAGRFSWSRSPPHPNTHTTR